MSGKDINEREENPGADCGSDAAFETGSILDDLNPYDNRGCNEGSAYETGVWPVPVISIPAPAEPAVADAPDEDSSDEELTAVDLLEDSPLELLALSKLFDERDARKKRFRNMIFRGRCLMNKGHFSYAEKVFQRAANEGYHEANFQIGLLRANQVLREVETQGKPDTRDSQNGNYFDGNVMRRDLVEHFALMVDAVFRYADDHMLIQTKEVLEKAAALGLIDTHGPEQIDQEYKAILQRHRETSWDPLIAEDETDIRDVQDPEELRNILNLRNFQDIMVLLAEGRKADRYDMPRVMGVLMAKLVNFISTEAFDSFVKRFSEPADNGGTSSSGNQNFTRE